MKIPIRGQSGAGQVEGHRFRAGAKIRGIEEIPRDGMAPSAHVLADHFESRIDRDGRLVQSSAIDLDGVFLTVEIDAADYLGTDAPKKDTAPAAKPALASGGGELTPAAPAAPQDPSKPAQAS